MKLKKHSYKNINSIQISSYVISAILLTAIFPLKLFPCFLSGFITYNVLTFIFKSTKHITENKILRYMISTTIAILIVTIIILCIINVINFFLQEFQALQFIHILTNNILVNIQHIVSPLIRNYIPSDAYELRSFFINIIKSNMSTFQNFGKNTVHNLITACIGIILGFIILISKINAKKYNVLFPLKQALIDRLNVLMISFKEVVFAQIKISFINTILTCIFLYIVLPCFKISFPILTVVLAITFLFGLIPIIGNLISNTVIFFITLSVSLKASLIVIFFLIMLHKLEYIINAKIFSRQMNISMLEILSVMLIFDSIFGISGMIAAPLYYSYIKNELRILGLI